MSFPDWSQVKGKPKLVSNAGYGATYVATGPICRVGRRGPNWQVGETLLEHHRNEGLLPVFFEVTLVTGKERWMTPEIDAQFMGLPAVPHWLVYQEGEGDWEFWIDHPKATPEKPGILWGRQEAWDAKAKLLSEMPLYRWEVVIAVTRLEAYYKKGLGLFQQKPATDTGRYPGEEVRWNTRLYRDLFDGIGALPIKDCSNPYNGAQLPDLKELAISGY